MSDIFLSYAREERDRAERLAAILEGMGWKVFWDLTIPAGLSWDEFIGNELDEARCVIVAWSARSVSSKWVREEAREGLKRNILVPVLFEDLEPPFGFRGIQAADLSAWDGDRRSPTLRQLVKDLERLLGAPPGQLEDENRRAESRARGRAASGAPRDAVGSKHPQPIGQARPAAAAEVRPRETETVFTKKTAKERAPGDDEALPGEVRPPTWEEDERLNPRILIEGGEFLMGSPPGVGADAERPQHRVRLSSFYLQEHEVTDEEYRRFDPSLAGPFPPDGSRRPAVNIAWARAVAYAEWLGGRLPTEAQWEFAARGKSGRTYPWGEEVPTPERAHYDQGFFGFYACAVKSHPAGATPEGIHDLAGNVWNWCLDWFASYSEDVQEDPVASVEGIGHVVRGGSYASGPEALRCAHRDWQYPNSQKFRVGFRVAFPLSAQPK